MKRRDGPSATAFRGASSLAFLLGLIAAVLQNDTGFLAALVLGGVYLIASEIRALRDAVQQARP